MPRFIHHCVQPPAGRQWHVEIAFFYCFCCLLRSYLCRRCWCCWIRFFFVISSLLQHLSYGLWIWELFLLADLVHDLIITVLVDDVVPSDQVRMISGKCVPTRAAPPFWNVARVIKSNDTWHACFFSLLRFFRFCVQYSEVISEHVTYCTWHVYTYEVHLQVDHQMLLCFRLALLACDHNGLLASRKHIIFSNEPWVQFDQSGSVILYPLGYGLHGMWAAFGTCASTIHVYGANWCVS